MHVNIDEVNTTRRKLAVEVPVEEVAAEFNRAFERVQKQAKLKGFRPGRAPRAVAREVVRRSGAHGRALASDRALVRGRREATGLRPVGPPEIVPESIEAGKPLALQRHHRRPCRRSRSATLAVCVRTGHVARSPRPTSIAPSSSCANRSRSYDPLEGREEAREGDFVSVDYEGFVEGRPLPAGKRDNRLFELGKGAVPPEFERAACRREGRRVEDRRDFLSGRTRRGDGRGQDRALRRRATRRAPEDRAPRGRRARQGAR